MGARRSAPAGSSHTGLRDKCGAGLCGLAELVAPTEQPGCLAEQKESRQ